MILVNQGLETLVAKKLEREGGDKYLRGVDTMEDTIESFYKEECLLDEKVYLAKNVSFPNILVHPKFQLLEE